MKSLYTLRISDSHGYYKYDLTIRLWFIHILIMWKPTHNNSREVEHYCSFQMYNGRTYHLIYKKRFGRVLNPRLQEPDFDWMADVANGR